MGMPVPPPLYSAEDRWSYLVAKNYFDSAPLSEEYAHQLEQLNFHYFLGFARNYAHLHDRDVFSGRRTIEHVFDLIALDHEVSVCLFEWVRRAELGLRTRTVDFFCANGSPTSYLHESRFSALSATVTEREIVAGSLKDIFRYGEDYVVKALERKAAVLGIEKPTRYYARQHDECVRLCEDLPLWAVIDSFTLGQLGKFIMSCDFDIEDQSQRTWRRIAHHLGLKAPTFDSGIKSLTNTRNLVCHHARLWMRPTTNSPKKARIFDKELRGVGPKSQFMAFANVAQFQHAELKRTAMAEITELVRSNDMYYHGISQTGAGNRRAIPA